MTAYKPFDLKWLLPLAIALLSLAISAYAGYSATDRETVQRITVTEAHQADDRKTLDEIKLAVKETDAKVTQVLILLSAKH